MPGCSSVASNLRSQSTMSPRSAASAQHFERDALFEIRRGALRQIDFAHPPAPDQPLNREAADDLALRQRAIAGGADGPIDRRRGHVEHAFFANCGEQCASQRDDRGRLSRVVQPARLLRRGEIDQFLERRLDRTPILARDPDRPRRPALPCPALFRTG